MAILPIGFFMPLPLPIMIPFMMWQSAAIATGFGTMFQYSKRRISAMDNDEFNKLDPVDLIQGDLDTFIDQIPSSFDKMSKVNVFILDAMKQMLEDALKWFGDIVAPGFIPGGGQPNFPGDEVPILPEPDVPVDTELLDPSFKTVKGWPTTKLNLAHEKQLHKYTSKAQGFIHSVFVHPEDKDKVPKGPPIEDVIKDLVFDINIFEIISKSHIRSWNTRIADGDARGVVITIGKLWATIKSKLAERPHDKYFQAMLRDVTLALKIINEYIAKNI